MKDHEKQRVNNLIQEAMKRTRLSPGSDEAIIVAMKPIRKRTADRKSDDQVTAAEQHLQARRDEAWTKLEDKSKRA